MQPDVWDLFEAKFEPLPTPQWRLTFLNPIVGDVADTPSQWVLHRGAQATSPDVVLLNAGRIILRQILFDGTEFDLEWTPQPNGIFHANGQGLAASGVVPLPFP